MTDETSASEPLIKTGDRVFLASGGPIMMVDTWSRDDGLIECFWFAGDELRQATFDALVLAKVP